MVNEEFNTPVVKFTKRRSSFFGFDQIPGKISEHESIDEQKYFEKLCQEEKDWFYHLKRISNKLKDFWRSQKELPEDVSVLSKERREYLEKAINVKEYVDSRDEFNTRAANYVAKKQWLNERYEYAIKCFEDKQIALKLEANKKLARKKREFLSLTRRV